LAEGEKAGYFHKSSLDRGLGSFLHFCKLALFFRLLRAVAVS